MNLTRESALALQRHYVGALITPATTWLEPLPAAHLAYSGPIVRACEDGSVLDFGTVDGSLDQKCSVRVFSPCRRDSEVRVSEAPQWIATEWAEPSSLLLVRVITDLEGEHTGHLTLSVRDERGTRTETLRVRILAAPRSPSATISFNGAIAPSPFAFASDDTTYTIDVANRNSVPLVVSFFDLPDWLELTVDGCSRSGPLSGHFFERRAPFTIVLRPRLLGRHTGVLRMQTNDRSLQLRDVLLPLTADVAPARPHVRVIPPQAPAKSSRKKTVALTHLENWGRTPARVTATTTSDVVRLPDVTLIAAASDGKPGVTTLPIRIAASQLEQGAHTMQVTLQIENGDPGQATVPIHVNVAEAPARVQYAIRPETFAAIVALLLLILAIVSTLKGWS